MSDYTPDYEAQERKRTALVADVSALLDPRDASIAERVVDHFCMLSPPMSPPVLMHMIRLNDFGRGGGESRKPGNLALNWHRLKREFPDIVMNTAGAIAVPWLIPFAALSIWNKVSSQATIELRKEHSTCLCAMWFRCDQNHHIDRETALRESGELFRIYGWPPLTGLQFDSYLQDLVAIECIEITNQQIWLREWIRKNY